MNYYLDALKKYAVFSGRADRAEYWYFVLFNILISFGLVIIGAIIGAVAGRPAAGMLLVDVYALATLLPAVGVTLRRLNDAGLNRWLILLALVPVANIVLIVLLCKESQPAAATA
jgi:uncharacterized membrane protein YhaH (DUF805 family)